MLVLGHLADGVGEGVEIVVVERAPAKLDDEVAAFFCDLEGFLDFMVIVDETGGGGLGHLLLAILDGADFLVGEEDDDARLLLQRFL